MLGVPLVRKVLQVSTGSVRAALSQMGQWRQGDPANRQETRRNRDLRVLPDPTGRSSSEKRSNTPTARRVRSRRFPTSGTDGSQTLRWRKTDSNSRSHREGKGYGEPLQASIAVSDLNL